MIYLNKKFMGQNFAKIGPEKSDFNLYQGFFMEKIKMAQISQILRISFSKWPEFYDKFQ